MEQLYALEVWLASMLAALAIGWIFGNRSAAIREDQGSGTSLADSELDDLFTLTVPPKIPARHPIPGRARSRAKVEERRPVSAPPIPVRLRNAMTAPVLSPAQRRMRSEIFAKMPPVNELQAQVRAIRQTDRVWDSPDIGERLAEFMRVADLGSLDALQHYRTAISELRRTNSQPPLAQLRPVTRVPRLTDAAPLNPKEPVVSFTVRAAGKAQDPDRLPRYAEAAAR